MRHVGAFFCILLVACGGATEADTPSDSGDTGDDHVRHLDTSVFETIEDAPVKQPLDAIEPPPLDSAVADTPPDTAIVVDSSGPDTHCEDCVSAKIAWGTVGTLVYKDTSSVRPAACRLFEHVRSQDGKADVSCMTDLLLCSEGPGITGGDIEGMLATPAVTAALVNSSSSGKPTSFGKLLPGYPYFQITRLDATIDVGSDCAGATGCTPPPADVQRLVQLLHDVDAEQMKRSPCSAIFPGGW
jgi:hypothetical protein